MLLLGLLLLLLHGSHDRRRGLLLLLKNLGGVSASEGRAEGAGVGHGSHSL